MRKLRINDDVIVVAGKNKGQSGKVLKIDWKNNRVTIDKINIVKVHTKPTQENPEGGIFEKEAPIHISNVAFKAKGKDGKGSKIGFNIDDKGHKTRVLKSTGKEA